jgi:hypothetical protein
MGWTYNVNGQWLDPRATWEAYAEQGGDTWQEQAPELAEECGARG